MKKELKKVSEQGEAYRYLEEDHSRQRGSQWKEPEQETCLTCVRNSEDSDVAAVG